MIETPEQINARRATAEEIIESALTDHHCKLSIEETLVDGVLVGRRVVVIPLPADDDGGGP